MQVYHVIQRVAPNHNTSYQLGSNWEESHDTAEQAELRAATMNDCRSDQCIGVHYDVIGPMNETEVFSG